MRPKENIERFVKNRKPHITVSADIDKRVLNDSFAAMEETMRAKSVVNQPNIWQIIMKTKMTKFAVAAVVIIAVIANLTPTSSGKAWAKVVEAFKAANNIHVVGKTSSSTTGEVGEFEWWIKNGNRSRAEYGSSTLIDDGTRRLWLLHQKKVARLSESGGLHEWALLQALRGEETEYPTETKLLEETDNGLMVYEIKEYILGEGRIYITTAWVDSRSNLPMRVAGKHIDRETGKTRVTFEATCDYEPIPDELFSTDLPPGYTEATEAEETEVGNLNAYKSKRGLYRINQYKPRTDANLPYQPRPHILLRQPPRLPTRVGAAGKKQ